jgi:hypothetical protein
MGSTTAELAELIRSGSQQVVGALRCAVGDGRNTDELTDLLKVMFTQRNQIDAAVFSTIGALDRAAEKAPGSELTGGLPSVKNGYRSAALRLSPFPATT